MDKFVCGTCKVTYNSLEIFSSHKRVCQKVNASNDTKANALNSCVESGELGACFAAVNGKVATELQSNDRPQTQPSDASGQDNTCTGLLGADRKIRCSQCQGAFLGPRPFTVHACCRHATPVIKPANDSNNVASVSSSAQDTHQSAQLPNIAIPDSDKSLAKKSAAAADASRHAAVDESLLPITVQDIAMLPVFLSDTEAAAFEDHCSAVDLSIADGLYTRTEVEQPVSGQCRQLVVYQCTACSRLSSSVQEARLHCLIHTDIMPFACTHCTYATSTRWSLSAHMRRHTGQTFKCPLPQCRYETTTRVALFSHTENHRARKLTCELCNKGYTTIDRLRSHVSTKHKNTEAGKQYLTRLPAAQAHSQVNSLLSCAQCGIMFLHKYELDNHMAGHVNGLPLQCGLCGKHFLRGRAIRNHWLTHRLVYICALCGHLCRSAAALREHLIASHPTDCHDEQLFAQCISTSIYKPNAELNAALADNVVSSGFLQATNRVDDDDLAHVSADIRNHVAGYQRMNMNVLAAIEQIYGSIECSICGKHFHNSRTFESHANVHSTRNNMWLCKVCNKYRASSTADLNRHTRVMHSSNLSCPQCSFAAKSYSQLWKHRRTKHQTSGKYPCAFCSKSFAMLRWYKQHLNLCHPQLGADELKKIAQVEAARKRSGFGRRGYQCTQCFPPRTFIHRHDYVKHQWAHEDFRPVKCPRCEFTCRTTNNLKSHMLRHTEEKNYECHYCDKRFKSAQYLYNHEQVHTRERVFKCPKCPFEALQRSQLKRHMPRHIMRKQATCTLCDYSCNSDAYLRTHYKLTHDVNAADSARVTNSPHAVSKARQKGKQSNRLPASKRHQTYLSRLSGESVPRGAAAADKVPYPDRLFRCLPCNYVYGSTYELRRHLIKKHSVEVDNLVALKEVHTSQVLQVAGTEDAKAIVDIGIELVDKDDVAGCNASATETVSTSDMYVSHTHDNFGEIQRQTNGITFSISVPNSHLQAALSMSESHDGKQLLTVEQHEIDQCHFETIDGEILYVTTANDTVI